MWIITKSKKRVRGGNIRHIKVNLSSPGCAALWSSSATWRVEKIFPLLLNAKSKAGSASFSTLNGIWSWGWRFRTNEKSIYIPNRDYLKTYRKSELKKRKSFHAVSYLLLLLFVSLAFIRTKNLDEAGLILYWD